MFETLATLVQPWADFYSNSAIAGTGLIAVHMLAMFVGGGMAIGADRTVLRATAVSLDDQRAVATELSTTHTIVISSLMITILTGLLLFATDVPNFSASKVYWTKMGTFAALLLNGVRMRRAESALLKPLSVPSDVGAVAAVAVPPAPASMPLAAWGAVRSSAMISLALWVSLVFLGVLLTNG